MKKTLFGEEQLERITSPERLNRYIRVAGPGAWMVLSALLLLAAGFLVWGFTGTISRTLEVQGIVERNGEVSCYLSSDIEVEKLEGCRATISGMDRKKGTYSGQISKVSSYPFSKEEASSFLSSDWLLDRLIKSDYVYQVIITPNQTVDLEAQSMVNLVIVTSEVRPIQFVLE